MLSTGLHFASESTAALERQLQKGDKSLVGD
jgi:hypothetical protein